MDSIKAALVFGVALFGALGASGGVAWASGAPPTFEQIIASPDDPKLNIDYAQAQAEAGHLLEAAAALERVLLANPNQSDARLVYAVVLYRLDDLQNAAEQLKLIDDKALSPLQRIEADRYRRQIAHRRQGGFAGAQIGGQVAIGVGYDSDAAGALLTQLNQLFGPVVKQSGTGAVVSGDIHAALPVGSIDGLSVIGSLAGYDRETVSGGTDQIQTFEGRFGVGFTERVDGFSVVGIARTYRVLDHHYLDEFGGRAEARWRPSTSTTLSASIEGVQQSYDIPVLDQLVQLGVINGNDNGARYNAELDIAHRFNARSMASAGIGYETKQAGYRPFGYKAPFVQGRWDVGLPRGAYASVSANVRFMQYDGVDLIFVGAKRRDTNAGARLAIGAPFSVFAPQGVTGDVRDHLALEASVNYATRDSTEPVAYYQDYGAELRVIWRFGSHD